MYRKNICNLFDELAKTLKIEVAKLADADINYSQRADTQKVSFLTEEDKIISIKKLFKYIKRNAFLDVYSETLEPGFDHRFSGSGTNKSDKKNLALTKDDEIKICDAWDKFKLDAQNIIDKTRASNLFE